MKINYTSTALFILLSGLAHTSNAAVAEAQRMDAPQGVASENDVDYNLFYQIPSWIDATPTFLPPQSTETILTPPNPKANLT